MNQIGRRIERLDWAQLLHTLDTEGVAVTPPIVPAAVCRGLAATFDDLAYFRKTIDLAIYDGRGTYRYFRDPLPPVVATLRRALYPHLVRLANEWAARLGRKDRYPPALDELLALCHAHRQRKQTCVLLHYQAGGYNALHQDLYGEIAFPLQAAVCLDREGTDFTGGELLLLEERPERQSRARVIRPKQGALVIFSTHHRPVRDGRRTVVANMRHGVSTIHSGMRTSLGLVFTDTNVL